MKPKDGPPPTHGSTLVYSTAGGRHCRSCGAPTGECRCRGRRGEAARAVASAAGDGKVRVRRETKGRKGKTVTTVTGLTLADDELRTLAAELKRACGSGGAIKEGSIEIQGDHADRLVLALRERGWNALRAGG